MGAKRLSHAEVLRRDEVLQKIFEWNKGVPSQSILSRFFRKFKTNDNDQLFGEIQRKWFEQFSIDKVTIDIDSTVINFFFSATSANGLLFGIENGSKCMDAQW